MHILKRERKKNTRKRKRKDTLIKKVEEKGEEWEGGESKNLKFSLRYLYKIIINNIFSFNS